MEMKVIPDSNGTFSVLAYKKGVEVDGYTDVSIDEIQVCLANIKRDNFTILDHVEAVLPDMHCDRILLSEDVTCIWEYRFARINGKKVKIDYTMGKDANTSYAEVLANLWVGALDVQKHGHDFNDINGFGNFCFAMDYDENKVSISDAIDNWTDGWNVWTQLNQIFTKEEVGDIMHAYYEGMFE